MADHAQLSPSGAHRWMRCPGSVVLEADFPRTSSSYAAEGTCAHDLASTVLTDPEFVIPVGETRSVDGFEILITRDMAKYVMDYANYIWRTAGEGAHLLVEQRVDFSAAIGVPDSFGTADAMILKDRELIVVDLKYGAGVKVDVEFNDQLQMYALGALEAVSLFADDIEIVTMTIYQPRMDHVSTWTVSVDKLREFADYAKVCAKEVMEALRAVEPAFSRDFLKPGDKQCRFCDAKAVCPALREEVANIAGPATATDFAQFLPEPPDAETGLNYLSIAMSKVDLVEHWCKAVRAEVERRLLAGIPVDGYKLVAGKKGNRTWTSEEEAEALLKGSMRLPDADMYTKNLISPTQAAKLLKDTPKRWKRVEALITRGEGKPSVAPVTDKREAIIVSNLAEEFGALATGTQEP